MKNIRILTPAANGRQPKLNGSYPTCRTIRSGLTLLGGEPMENADDLLELVQAVRRAVPEKSIWVYSGFLYEEILAQPARKALLEACDVLVDGPFVDALKDPGLYFRGSSNQRIIDVAKSREAGKAVLLWPDRR